MLPTLSGDKKQKCGWDFLKRASDIVIALILLILTSLLWVITAICIVLDSRGPLMYKQKRVGLDGNLFFIYKFRTMYDKADTRGPAVTSIDDHRVTRVGRCLRSTKLDELPQLLNVLKGDMSLVGPRPQVPQYVALFDPTLREIVLRVRPGITGPTALEYRHEEHMLADKEDREGFYIEEILPKKLEMDAHYVRTCDLRYDFRILSKTAGTLCLGLSGKIFRKITRPFAPQFVLRKQESLERATSERLVMERKAPERITLERKTVERMTVERKHEETLDARVPS